LLIEALYLGAQVSDGHDIGTAGMGERIAHALCGFGSGSVASGEQMIELVERELEGAGEPWTYPGLRLGLTALPARDRGPVNAQPFRELFLAETDRFAPGRETLALCRHQATSDLRRLRGHVPVRASQRRACDIFAAVLRSSCSVHHRREPIVFLERTALVS